MLPQSDSVASPPPSTILLQINHHELPVARMALVMTKVDAIHEAPGVAAPPRSPVSWEGSSAGVGAFEVSRPLAAVWLIGGQAVGLAIATSLLS
jgi:hypothetical protein